MASLPDHDHCLNCGDPIPSDMRYCCMDCYNEHQAKKKKDRIREVMFWGSAAVLVIAIISLALLF